MGDCGEQRGSRRGRQTHAPSRAWRGRDAFAVCQRERGSSNLLGCQADVRLGRLATFIVCTLAFMVLALSIGARPAAALKAIDIAGDTERLEI
jgi:hypothetical protein